MAHARRTNHRGGSRALRPIGPPSLATAIVPAVAASRKGRWTESTGSLPAIVADTPVVVTREQILAFRRATGFLDERLASGRRSLRSVAWAGLQDSMPRAAVLSVHARMHGTGASVWEDPAYVQVWGPRYSVFVVPARDVAVFTLGRLPDAEPARDRAYGLAARLRALLDGAAMRVGEAGRTLGVHPNQLRYAATTGTVLIRWDGAAQPTVRTVAAPDVDPAEARRELARRYLHVFGPSTEPAFAAWAGLAERSAAGAFDDLRRSLAPVVTPIGPAWMLDRDVATLLDRRDATGAVRLLPSGDAYYLLQGRARELLVPQPRHQALLWTARVWPGAILVDGEIAGTWRRTGNRVTAHPWARLSRRVRAAVEAEAASLPLPDGDAARLEWGG